jgi:hypothetical protein
MAGSLIVVFEGEKYAGKSKIDEARLASSRAAHEKGDYGRPVSLFPTQV